MGREAHLQRLILGRNPDLPPDWDSLKDQYERVSEPGHPAVYRCIDEENEQSYGLTFDEKGRPYCPQMRELQDRLCEAQNAVTVAAVGAAVGAAMKQVNPGDDNTHPPFDGDEVQSQTDLASGKRYRVSFFATCATDLVEMSTGFYIKSLLYRILVWKSANALSISQLIYGDFCNHTFSDLFTRGFGITLFYNMVRPFSGYTSHRFSSIPRHKVVEEKVGDGAVWYSFSPMWLYLPSLLVFDLSLLRQFSGRQIFRILRDPQTLLRGFASLLRNDAWDLVSTWSLLYLTVKISDFVFILVDRAVTEAATYGRRPPVLPTTDEHGLADADSVSLPTADYSLFNQNSFLGRIERSFVWTLYRGVKSSVVAVDWRLSSDDHQALTSRKTVVQRLLYDLSSIVASLIVLPFKAPSLRAMTWCSLHIAGQMGNKHALGRLQSDLWLPGTATSLSIWRPPFGTMYGFVGKVGLCFALQGACGFAMLGIRRRFGLSPTVNNRRIDWETSVRREFSPR